LSLHQFNFTIATRAD